MRRREQRAGIGGEKRRSGLIDVERPSIEEEGCAIRQLEQEGWVAKKADPADRRRALVELTPKGRQRLLDARRDNGRAVAERLARRGHTADDVARAVGILRDVMAEKL